MPAKQTTPAAHRQEQTDPWTTLATRLPEFPSAVLTGIDGQGYPYSVRCQPVMEPASRTLAIQMPPGAFIQPGPVSLLCHRHDEHLWRQRSFLVRGTLARQQTSGTGWAFTPREFVEGIGSGGMLEMVSFVIRSRRAASSYLARRGLPRPSIPLDDVLAAKRSAAIAKPRQSHALRSAMLIGAICGGLLLTGWLVARGRRSR